MPNIPSRADIERKAIETYGKARQILKSMEECAELIIELWSVLETTPAMKGLNVAIEFEFLAMNANMVKEVCKALGDIEGSVELNGINNDENIRLEIADVKITAGDQLPMIFGSTLIEEDYKLTRQAERMGMLDD